MATYGVILLSGGLDSTTVAAHAKEATDHLSALTFHYGQSHSKEVACAQEIARLMGIEHHLLDISFFGKVAWYSALTSPESFPLQESRPGQPLGVSIPITYVPLRNTFFLALGAAFLESQVLYAIEVEAVDPKGLEVSLFMAPNAIDYSGYPDCRPEYFEKMSDALAYGSKMGTEYQIPIRVETPIIHMSKSEIVKMGLKLRAPLELTWSCYHGGPVPCGTCDSCLLRAKGFRDAGLLDPALERLREA